ncbi:PREDICTED: probable leucine-rich repeat receptor-like protein kinase At2g33170 [Ipomoea nil]|uniref:probable leucine-rich repeat receptor-like protein kinase At2g33170 n=1 Tax=Ipomoea nil TaxID=35883 RepID=UPI0009014E55|nr:PREDICTED: probable leucine-rich repeat receptor-like protein kinase At2g33170 [Ipomoea nil]
MAKSSALSSTYLCLYTTALATTILTLMNPCFLNAKTLESDVQVLRSFKDSIDPNSVLPASFLSSWNLDLDPCEATGTHFLGILCMTPSDNSSGRISVIDLEGDGLEGFLTPEIGNLTELTTLNLNRNKFRGPIPDSIINLRKITRLLLSENFFSGGLPRYMRRLRKLEVIDVSHNRLSGSIPATITALRELTRLDLSNNELTGKIPDLSGLWQLNTLALSSNQFFAGLPPFPVRLRTLLLGHNLLTGHISAISRLRYLTALDLSDNRFSGPILHRIVTLPELMRINVSANHFTRIEVTKSSTKESRLQVLDAHSNLLQGHLPLNIITYLNLKTVNLGHNRFFGKIPKEYGSRLRSLWRNLNLEYNYLEGTLPSEFMTGGEKARASLDHNCLNCPDHLPWCLGGQRPASQCRRSAGGIM